MSLFGPSIRFSSSMIILLLLLLLLRVLLRLSIVLIVLSRPAVIELEEVAVDNAYDGRSRY